MVWVRRNITLNNIEPVKMWEDRKRTVVYEERELERGGRGGGWDPLQEMCKRKILKKTQEKKNDTAAFPWLRRPLFCNKKWSCRWQRQRQIQQTLNILFCSQLFCFCKLPKQKSQKWKQFPLFLERNTFWKWITTSITWLFQSIYWIIFNLI